MADLLDRVPGDIPGLLRLGSPVVEAFGETNDRGVVVAFNNGGVQYAIHVGPEHYPTVWSRAARGLALDLTDPTGRAHAAWWLRERMDDLPHESLSAALMMTEYGAPMTPTQIDTLARAVLAVAGREAG